MSDWLVKLYDLPPAAAPTGDGTAVRKPIGPEHRVLTDWVASEFSPGWASEVQVALANRPLSVFIAVCEASQRPALLGFACYDATLRGLFGPIGVSATAQRQGLGARLLRACLDDMRAVGYGYAVVGAAGPGEFFRRSAGAVEIPGSSPGVYRGMLKAMPLAPVLPAVPAQD